MPKRPPMNHLQEGASQEVVDHYKEVAGDGDLDERCRRIVRNWWVNGMPWDLPSQDEQDRLSA